MSKKMIPLKKFAEQNTIGYRTAYRYWSQGYLEGTKLPNGTIMISGWKEDKSKTDNEVKDKPIILTRKSVKSEVEELMNLAHDKGFSNLDIKSWNGKIYESNIILIDMVKAGYNVFFIVNTEDAFGVNHKTIASLLEAQGITLVSLNSDGGNTAEESIYSLLVAMSRMLKATVGMHGYKKEISELINKIVS